MSVISMKQLLEAGATCLIDDFEELLQIVL